MIIFIFKGHYGKAKGNKKCSNCAATVPLSGGISIDPTESFYTQL